MRALVLLSSGIDSPVSAYIMAKQGVKIQAIHFNNSQNKQSKSVEMAKQLAKKLSQITKQEIKLHIMENFHNQEQIMKNTENKYQCVLCKRLMYRIAEKIAQEEKCDVLLTGENLGQVASQTLQNMKVLTQSIKMPVIRPLLCYEKQEIITIAQEIDTYKLSIQDKQGCPFVPQYPITKAQLQKVKIQEQKLELADMIEKTITKIG